MKPLPPCVFPSLTEQDVVTVPGRDAGTAYRLRVEPGMHGYLRIEQLGYNHNLGWYTQKSFCLPGEVVHQLMPHLKQAVAMIPHPGVSHTATRAMMPDHGPLRFPAPADALAASVEDARKEA